MLPTHTLREMMIAYDSYRARWIEKRGNDNGFDEWFTQQVKWPEKTEDNPCQSLSN